MEEFLILEGDLVDSDGTIFGPGDFASYEAGTHHNSWTESGFLLAVFEWCRPQDARAGSRILAAEGPKQRSPWNGFGRMQLSCPASVSQDLPRERDSHS